MAEKSRVKFNPGTKEIEVEGSESFVKTTLDRLLAIISGAVKGKVKVKRAPKAVKAAPVKADKKKPKAVKVRPPKKAKKIRQSKKPPKMTTGTKRGALSKAVLTLIQSSTEGVSMAELKEKTGMKDIQIRNVLSSVIKRGKIRTVKRGVYVGITAPEASPVEKTE
jgi:hypothetical protein